MSNYKIEVRIEIEKTDHPVSEGMNQVADGSFNIVVPQKFAESIDKCEKALLAINYPAIREALSHHMSEISRQEAERYGIGLLKKNLNLYQVEGEVGRFGFETYSKTNSYGEELYNTSREFFVPLQGEAKYRTEGFNEIALIYGTTELSFRKTTALINRARYQEEGGTPFRTIRDNTEYEGRQIQEYLEQKTMTIFKENRFVPDAVPQDGVSKPFVQTESVLKEEYLRSLSESCNIEDSFKSEIAANPVPYEDPGDAVNISLDDVGAKKQKEKREKQVKSSGVSQETAPKRKRQYVQNTVVHIEKRGRSYILNGYGVPSVLKLLIGFLFYNDLWSNTLVFFIDGHSLFSQVTSFFFRHDKVIIILDWYHLKKKCTELLSMALNGKEIRNAVLEELMPLLWHGLTDQAIKLLENLAEDKIRNEERIVQLTAYLEKNKAMIPAYEIRKKIGLRNSSNLGEKANELLVSHRQKHNGMSWSKTGSVALTSVTALKKNNEYLKWFQDGEIDFKLAA